MTNFYRAEGGDPLGPLDPLVSWAVNQVFRTFISDRIILALTFFNKFKVKLLKLETVCYHKLNHIQYSHDNNVEITRTYNN